MAPRPTTVVETVGHSTNLPFVSFPQENTLTGFGGATLSVYRKKLIQAALVWMVQWTNGIFSGLKLSAFPGNDSQPRGVTPPYVTSHLGSAYTQRQEGVGL